MSKATTVHICQACGFSQSKWAGQCESCQAWNTLVEEVVSTPPKSLKQETGHKLKSLKLEFTDLTTKEEPPDRVKVGVNEVDRVFGGGIVASSVTLIGGDPGIGKSTLLLQIAARISKNGLQVAYISGEESVHQIKERAKRLKNNDSPVALAAETDLRKILTALRTNKPQFVVIDSIQTLWSENLGAAAGSVTQVRACAAELTRWAKRTGAMLVIVGHVTKEGTIAGPRVLEHMVDTVFYLEGERSDQFRILRSVKNRFGPTDEIGIFEMAAQGLIPAKEPSALFLSDESDQSGGVAVFAAMEGSRPMLIEVQALVSKSVLAMPRRSVVGWDTARLAMLLAVLETRCGIRIHDKDVYLSVCGGYRITEPAGDLAVAAALLTSLANTSIDDKSVYIGEVALSGSIRPVGRMDQRLSEVERLGFECAIVPKGSPKSMNGLNVKRIPKLADLVDWIVPGGPDG